MDNSLTLEDGRFRVNFGALFWRLQHVDHDTTLVFERLFPVLVAHEFFDRRQRLVCLEGIVGRRRKHCSSQTGRLPWRLLERKRFLVVAERVNRPLLLLVLLVLLLPFGQLGFRVRLG